VNHGYKTRPRRERAAGREVRGSLATLWTLARVPARRRITCRAARRFVQPRGAAAPAERFMEGTKISPSRPHALARRGQPPRLAHRSLPRLRNHTHTLQASANSQRAPARSEQTGRPSVSHSLTHTVTHTQGRTKQRRLAGTRGRPVWWVTRERGHCAGGTQI